MDGHKREVLKTEEIDVMRLNKNVNVEIREERGTFIKRSTGVRDFGKIRVDRKIRIHTCYK